MCDSQCRRHFVQASFTGGAVEPEHVGEHDGIRDTVIQMVACSDRVAQHGGDSCAGVIRALATHHCRMQQLRARVGMIGRLQTRQVLRQ
ncbi:hypothetical protein D3C72_2190250 [compost metagenome]